MYNKVLMMLQERGLTPEILQVRSDCIIAGYQKMILNGLSADNIRAAVFQDSQAHQDMFQVYLGLKPAAGFLSGIFRTYLPSADIDYLSSIRTDVDVVHNPRGYIWNPQAIENLLFDPRLMRFTNYVFDKPEFAKISASPYEVGFGDFFHLFSHKNSRGSETVLEGVLYGYPLGDAIDFARLQGRVVGAALRIEEEAKRRGLEIHLPEQYNFRGLVTDQDGIKSELLRLASEVGFEDTEVLEYIRVMRLSQVPGFPYITTGTVTAEEGERSRLYNRSKLDEKLALLLA